MAYTFSLSDKILNFGTVAMFIIAGLQAIFNVQFVDSVSSISEQNFVNMAPTAHLLSQSN